MEKSTIGRDLILLLLLLGAFYLLNQFLGLGFSLNSFSSLNNTHTLMNNCAGIVILRNANGEQVRIASGETKTYQPWTSAEMWYQNSGGELVEVSIKINDQWLLTGQGLPSNSDIFGRNPQIVACP